MRGAEFLKAVKRLGFVSIILCILVVFSQKVRVLLKKLGEMRKSSSYRKKFTQGTDKIVRPNETFEFPSIRVIESQLYTFSFHHKQCASEKKDFTLVKFTSQIFSSADKSIKEKMCLLLLLDGLLVILHTFAFIHKTSVVKRVSSVSIVLRILIMFRYTFWAFTTRLSLKFPHKSFSR